MSLFAEARPFLPIDLPLVRRLIPHGLSLDSATSLTRGVHILEGAVWGSVPLTDLGTSTFVLRSIDRRYDKNFVAQFRHKAGNQHAHIVFIAPDLEFHIDRLAWLQLLDTMVATAGRRGALTLNAEVDENSTAFEVLREAGYAVYARQSIWRHAPDSIPADRDLLRPETEQDAIAISALVAHVVPRLVLQGDGVPESGGGLIYEQHGQALAYLAVQEGKCGIYIQPYIRPEIGDRVHEILASVWQRLPRAERLPVYVSIRRYQEWLQGSLTALDFEPWGSQAVMVKHTTARLEHMPAESLVRERVRAFALPPVTDYYDQTVQYRKGVPKN